MKRKPPLVAYSISTYSPSAKVPSGDSRRQSACRCASNADGSSVAPAVKT